MGWNVARRGGAIVAGLVIAAGSTIGYAASAGAAGIAVKPNSNLAVGGGSYPASVSAPKGTFPRVPDPAVAPSTRTVTTKLGGAAIVGAASSFSSLDLGSFVEDGPGGLLPDGVDVNPLTPLVAVYPRQGLAYIKSVNSTGTTATLSQKATAAGTGSVSVIAPATPLLLVTQSSGSIPFIVAEPTGLCLGPLFLGGLCPLSAGNLANDATRQVTFANPDGSLAPTAFTIVEGGLDGGLGTTPGPIFTKVFDPDGSGFAPFAGYAVPSTESGVSQLGCAPGLADRLIPNPLVGGVDYCMVNVLVLNAGVQTSLIPYALFSIPLTWTASAAGGVLGSDFVVGGSDFANNDTIVKIQVANGKAKVTGSPTVKCPALNQRITGVVADATGGVISVIANYASGCTVPSGSITKVTLIGSKDVQKSQIPPNAIIGTNAAKKASVLVTMP